MLSNILRYDDLLYMIFVDLDIEVATRIIFGIVCAKDTIHLLLNGI